MYELLKICDGVIDASCGAWPRCGTCSTVSYEKNHGDLCERSLCVCPRCARWCTEIDHPSRVRHFSCSNCETGDTGRPLTFTIDDAAEGAAARFAAAAEQAARSVEAPPVPTRDQLIELLASMLLSVRIIQSIFAGNKIAMGAIKGALVRADGTFDDDNAEKILRQCGVDKSWTA